MQFDMMLSLLSTNIQHAMQKMIAEAILGMKYKHTSQKNKSRSTRYISAAYFLFSIFIFYMLL